MIHLEKLTYENFDDVFELKVGSIPLCGEQLLQRCRSVCYTEYDEDYEKFYKTALRDAEEAKKTREYGFDIMNHPNCFDASCICLPSYLSIAATSCFKRSAVFGSPRSRARVSMSEESAFSDSFASGTVSGSFPFLV